MTTLGQLINRSVQLLRPTLGGGAMLEARLVIEHALELNRTQQLTRPETAITEGDAQRVLSLIDRRVVGEPLAYIIGEREFFGLPFRVGPGALIPRPDSELLVETALDHLADPKGAYRVLDIGVGSGCLLLSTLHHRPHALGLGVDRSHAALAWAGRNRHALGLANQALLVQSEWLESVAGPFDVILCNPPYVATGDPDLASDVAAFEPEAALLAGTDGLDAYRHLLPRIGAALAPGAIALFEIGHRQGQAVLGLAQAAGWRSAQVLQDLGGRDRCLAVRAS